MPPNSSDCTNAQGSPFGERYQIVKKLGGGGMGTVFHAFDKTLKKDVAIKVLLKGLQPDKAMRFQQEAKAAAKLNHPNVVRVLNLGETPAGDLFLVMDYARGTSLESIINRDDHIDVVSALPLFVQFR